MKRQPPFFFPREVEQLLPPPVTPWQTMARIRLHRFVLAAACLVLLAIVIAQWRTIEALREALRLCR